MKKPEFITAVAEEAQGTKKEARKYVDAVETVVAGALERGEDVELRGFVTFASKEVAEGLGRNPQTGEQIVVPAHRKSSAKLAKGLRKH